LLASKKLDIYLYFLPAIAGVTRESLSVIAGKEKQK